MSNIKLVHSGGNSVSLTTPDSNPAANRTFKLPGADGSAGQALVTDGSGALSFAGTGKILQIKQSIKTDTQSFSTGSSTLADSFFDITGLSVTLTPASGTKCFVSYSVTVGGEAGYGGGLALFRDSTQVFRGPASGSRVRLSNFVQQHEQNQLDVLSNQFLDTHGANGSTAVTYKLQMYVATPGRTTRVNRGQTWSDSRAFGSIISQITVMEVAS
tara:strand:- start:44 stop:688 length:645 start_codon:yes stop_codon:yes gene_type:complete